MDNDEVTITPSSVKCGCPQELYFIFKSPSIKLRQHDTYGIIFQGDKRSTKAHAVKFNMFTLKADFPIGLLPGITSYTIVHNQEDNRKRRIGSGRLRVIGPTNYTAQVLPSIDDPLELMCNAANLNLNEHSWETLDKTLQKAGKDNMPDGFERIFRTDQITTGIDTVSSYDYPSALHFAAKHDLKDLCLLLLTWPGALQTCITRTKHGETPSSLARNNGNNDLAAKIDDYVDDAMEAAEYHQYEYADQESKGSSTKYIPPQGSYVTLQSGLTPTQPGHDYSNIDDRHEETTEMMNPLREEADQEEQRSKKEWYTSVVKDKAKESTIEDLAGPRSIAYIDHRERKLTIDYPAATLRFPPDSLQFGEIKEISLGTCWSEDYPPIKDDQMVMGPVIQCLPDGMTFQKHVHLTLPCVMLDLSLKSLEVWCREKSHGYGKPWDRVFNGSQPATSSVKVALVSDSLVLSIPHFSRFSILLRRRKAERKILVFLSPVDLSSTGYVYVKVYAVREDKEQETILAESRCGGYTCAMPTEFEVKPKKKDLTITLTERKPDHCWQPDETKKIIPYKLLQKGGLPCTCVFTLTKQDRQTRSIRGSLSIEQEGNDYAITDLKFDLIFVPQSVLPLTTRLPVSRAVSSEVASPRRIQDVVPDYRGSYEDHHVLEATPTASQLDQENHYHMATKTKGLAIVINILTFPSRQRFGSEVDLTNIVHLFQEIGYEVEWHQDLTSREISLRMKTFAARLNSSSTIYNSAVVVLMSHGDSGVIYGRDENSVSIKDIQEELNGDKCPRMRGKPKMFFIQACRGTSQMGVIEADGDNVSATGTSNSSINANIQQRHSTHQSSATQEADNSVVDVQSLMEDVPKNSDMHLAYATTDGYLSLRSQTEGSWFIQALLEVFISGVHVDSLGVLMNKVNRYVADLKGRMHEPTTNRVVFIRQTPELVSRMRKTLYFLPGYPP